ncbi:MAG: ATP-binding protein [Aggregatilineales bacterium]
MGIASAVIAICIAVYGCVLISIIARARRMRAGHVWFGLALLTGALALSLLILPEETFTDPLLSRGELLSAILSLQWVAFGALAWQDLNTIGRHAPRPWLWIILGMLWLVSFFILLLRPVANSTGTTIGVPGWVEQAVSAGEPAALLLIGGFVALTILLVSYALVVFYRAKLPEMANRALLWALTTGVLALGSALLLLGYPLFPPFGAALSAIGIALARAALSTSRVFTVRRDLVGAARACVLLLLFVTFAIGLGAVLNVAGSEPLVNVLIALLGALLYFPLQHLIRLLFSNWRTNRSSGAARAARYYSQKIAGVTDINALAKAAAQAVVHSLRTRRAGLILVSPLHHAHDQFELRCLAYPDGHPVTRGRLDIASPIFSQLAVERQPLSQYMLEYSRAFEALPPDESAYFEQLEMAAYAPIMADNKLIGILAAGLRSDDAPFQPRDLDLLASLASQTVTALHNARLLAHLRSLNAEMRTLNQTLEAAKEQVEKLDSVKTDFITVASHELRTPLAQIRGYTDILDALNEQEAIDRDQIAAMVVNLRSAAERMDELIAAMLDVSQLDVDAMDLHFAETSVEAVVRAAVEPLIDVLRSRKLTLSARGVRSLPLIQADAQRLVQALRNVVVNAIKFTPDGGRIEITGSRQPAETPDTAEQVLITIADTGVGIARENQELIFSKFFRAYDPALHSSGAYKFMGAGPGLGLTIARGVIEGHGGRIWVESSGYDVEALPGSTFYILLPVSPPETARRVAAFDRSTNPARAG